MPECRLADGQVLHYRESGSGQPLLLLHGWGMSSAVFDEVATRLAQRTRCICLDLPGHGASQAAAELTLEGLAEAVEALIDELGLEQAVLLGWSLGGQVAQLLASRRQVELAGLILVSTTPRFVAGAGWPHGLPVVQLRALRRDLQRAYARTLGEFFKLMFASEQLAPERFRAIVRFAAGAARLPDEKAVLAGLELLQSTDLRGQLAIELPCLVLHGELDRIIPAGAGNYLAAQISGAQLMLFPTAGHAPFLCHPEQFCARLESFLHGY